MTSEQVGMCLGTLAPDPMTCDEAAFADMVAGTAQAGFRTVAVWPLHTAAMGDERARRVLDDAGLRVAAVEAVYGWGGGDTPDARGEVRTLCGFAERMGADIVGACVFEPLLTDVDATTAGFAAICDEAAEHGQRVALEFLPWTGIADLATAWRIIDGAGRANGGLLLDTWHWTRQPGGPDFELLRRIPGDRIFYLQLCDAAPTRGDDVMGEAMTNRLLPGDGVVDFTALLDALDDMGADPWVAAEVFNTRLAGRGPAEMARAVRERATAAVRRALPQSMNSR